MNAKHMSPLRYPGGKFKIIPLVEKLFINNNLGGCTFIEPFAGGANVGLNLLNLGYINKLILNDLDYGVYCFWYSVLNHTDRFCSMVEDINV